MPNPPLSSPATQRLEPHPWLVSRDSAAAGMAAPRVRQLMRVVEPILASSISLDALARFHADPALFALPVVDPLMRPVALIQRHVFLEFLGRLYSRELFGKRTLSYLLAEDPAGLSMHRHMVVDANTSIDDVAQSIAQSDMRHMVSGFIVTEGEAYAGVASGQDLLNEITLRKQAQLYYLAHYDSLTGVPNRMLFTDRLTQSCLEARRSGALLGLLFVDVDRFKQVNDSMGHRFGDLLLQAVTQRIQGCIRACDTVARLGGDEFAILLDGLAAEADAEMMALRLVEAVREPFHILDRRIHISFSVGVAVFPLDDAEVGALLTKADAAMYEVKINGRNGLRRYGPDIAMLSPERFSLEADLKQALANDEFFLVYQPQLDVKTGAVVGVEALVRWRHRDKGVLTPGSFIGVAEESGVIVPLGDWILAEACRQMTAWSASGLPPLRMAVNISAAQFRQPDFAARVRGFLHEFGVRPGSLELELTESMVMQNSQQVRETLDALRGLGVQLSLDDFGTGFSSLGYLRSFPIDRLKIDQSFVRDVHELPVNASIIQAIVGLARSLGMEVVAEGVEKAEEFAVLRANACDETQGYFHARPMPADAFAAWLEDHLSMFSR